MTRGQLTSLVGIIVLAIAGLAYTFASGNEPLLGLDLQGGVSVVLQPTPSVNRLATRSLSAGLRSVTKTFHRKMGTLAAIMKAPTVERKFSSVQPALPE